MTPEKLAELSGADLLRIIVSNLDRTREDALDGFTAEQLIQIGRMHLLSEWDFYPDQWTKRQVDEALSGKPPRWNVDEQPMYD